MNAKRRLRTARWRASGLRIWGGTLLALSLLSLVGCFIELPCQRTTWELVRDPAVRVEAGAARLEYALAVEVTPEGAASPQAEHLRVGVALSCSVRPVTGGSVRRVGITLPSGASLIRQGESATLSDIMVDCDPLAGCRREYRAWAELAGVSAPSTFAVDCHLEIGIDDCPDVMEVDPSWLRVEATRLDAPAGDASVPTDGGM